MILNQIVQTFLQRYFEITTISETSKRPKNARNPALVEEDRIIAILDEMLADNKINDSIYQKLKPHGSQPARLYGTAKVHKDTIK